MAKHPHVPGPDSSKAAPDYVVGYGRPPEDGQFKSGHRKLGGRRKAQRNRRTVVDEAVNEKITLRRGRRSRRVTKFEAMIVKAADNAVLGNPKSLSTIIALLRELGLMGEPHEATPAESVTGDDAAVIADFQQRYGNQAEATESIKNPQAGKTESPSGDNKENKEKKS